MPVRSCRLLCGLAQFIQLPYECEFAFGTSISDIEQSCKVTSPPTGTQSIWYFQSILLQQYRDDLWLLHRYDAMVRLSSVCGREWLNSIRGWAGDPSCNGSSVTSSTSNTAWQNNEHCIQRCKLQLFWNWHGGMALRQFDEQQLQPEPRFPTTQQRKGSVSGPFSRAPRRLQPSGLLEFCSATERRA